MDNRGRLLLVGWFLLTAPAAASAADLANTGCEVSNRILTRAKNVASSTNAKNDGYDYLKRVYDPILKDGGHDELPADKGDGTWNHFWGPGQLKPGDMLSNADGSTGSWNGAIFAGYVNGEPMVITDGEGKGNPRLKPLKDFPNMKFFFARTHDMLCLTPDQRKTEQKLTEQTNKAEQQAVRCDLSQDVMEHAGKIGHEINSTGGYRFDGFNDCYGFVRRTWNPMLQAQGKPDLPVDDYPSSHWQRIDWNKLVPGDVLATAQGHHFGADWHGGMFAGMHNGVPYIYDDSGKSDRDGAFIRPIPFPGFFSYYYVPTHRMLEADQACRKDDFLVETKGASFIAR